MRPGEDVGPEPIHSEEDIGPEPKHPGEDADRPALLTSI